jgi:hypothetical protein
MGARPLLGVPRYVPPAADMVDVFVDTPVPRARVVDVMWSDIVLVVAGSREVPCGQKNKSTPS